MNIKQTSEKPKCHAARIVRIKLKETFSDEMDTFVCCPECHDDHDLKLKNRWKLLEAS